MDEDKNRLFSVMSEISLEIMKMRTGNLGISEKRDFRDIVTRADKFSEQRLSVYVQEYYPGDGIWGEEGSFTLSSSGYTWYFDPIDGTTNFACGPGFFAISARRAISAPGAHKDGEFAAVFFPASGEYLFTRRDSSRAMACFSDVLRPSSLRDSVMMLGITDGHESLFADFRKKSRNVLMLGSCVYEATTVVKGETAAYLHTGATRFDIAAVMLIAEMAGCIVGRPDGREINLDDESIPIIFAANQDIFQEVVATYHQYILTESV